MRLRARVRGVPNRLPYAGASDNPFVRLRPYRLSVSELDRLVRRLRHLTARGWRTQDRAAVVRRLAEELVAIGGEGHRLPELPEHALADVIAVVGADALVKDEAATSKLLAAALDATR